VCRESAVLITSSDSYYNGWSWTQPKSLYIIHVCLVILLLSLSPSLLSCLPLPPSLTPSLLSCLPLPPSLTPSLLSCLPLPPSLTPSPNHCLNGHSFFFNVNSGGHDPTHFTSFMSSLPFPLTLSLCFNGHFLSGEPAIAATRVSSLSQKFFGIIKCYHKTSNSRYHDQYWEFEPVSIS